MSYFTFALARLPKHVLSASSHVQVRSNSQAPGDHPSVFAHWCGPSPCSPALRYSQTRIQTFFPQQLDVHRKNQSVPRLSATRTTHHKYIQILDYSVAQEKKRVGVDQKGMEKRVWRWRMVNDEGYWMMNGVLNPWWLMRCLQTESFTQRSLYAEEFFTQKSLHRDVFRHRRFSTEKL